MDTARPMSLTFLGTSSGGGPTETRNCSSLLCEFFPRNEFWMVDCAEGTTRQFALQPFTPSRPRITPHQVTKIFVTHMHADHIMGLPGFLRKVLYPPRVGEPPPASYAIEYRKPPKIEVYGPAGIRQFIRHNLKMTCTHTGENYVVHELLNKDDPITPCDPPPDDKDPKSGFGVSDWNVVHCSETPGRDIRAGEDTFWWDITNKDPMAEILVNAGPIIHREPCIGYVFEEVRPPFRKVVILGDTCDPSAITPLCSNTSLLVHEATDSIISKRADIGGRLSRRSHEEVMEKTLTRGHSTPTMAGEFAKRIRAQKLVLNHIGGRFAAPRSAKDRGWQAVMDDIEWQATEAWEPPPGIHAIAAWDFMRVLVPMPDSQRVEIQSETTIAISSSLIRSQTTEVTELVADVSSSYMVTGGDDEDMDAPKLEMPQKSGLEENFQQGRSGISDPSGSISRSSSTKDTLGTQQQRRHYHTHNAATPSHSQSRHQSGNTPLQNQTTLVRNMLATTSLRGNDSGRNHSSDQRQNRQRTHSTQPVQRGPRTEQPHESHSQFRPREERDRQQIHSHQNQERQRHGGQYRQNTVSQSSTTTQGSETRPNKRRRRSKRGEGDKGGR